MLSQDFVTGVTFNGEIYGYSGIRDSLPDYQFHTSSDTEVILALYHRYGTDLLSRLPGMFSFALWDDSRQELFCARDRFGEKPFYYASGNNGEFLFASEIKAIIASGLVSPVLSLDSVVHYCRHLYVHPCATIYENIHTLPPAHTLSYSNGRVTVKRYWQIPCQRGSIEPGEAVERFQSLLDNAVAQQQIADVPVGAFLSGGLDSSTIVAIASRHQIKVKTFSFGFEDAINELPFAREIAQRYHTDHTELTAKDSNIAELIEGMQEVYDEPFADSSNIPTYLISQLSRRQVKVILTGDGGDELLAGYNWWYHPLMFMEQARGYSCTKSMIVTLSARLLARCNRKKALQRQFHGAGVRYSQRYNSIMDAHYAQNLYFTDEELGELGITGNAKADGKVFEKYSWQPSGTVQDALLMDIENYMPGDILVKTDRASMANGLELRAPFLDVDFASYCLSLPAHLKITKERDKAILRDAYAEAWTDSIRQRGKFGFGAPVDKWLARGSVQALKDMYLNNPQRKIFSLLSFENSRIFVKRNDYRTWILLVLAVWFEKHEFQMPKGL
jgi:asparagine synthase (glutamine-hydrolysing)